MAFKIGDIVVLKSGGPRMTIMQAESGKHVLTTWFAGAKKETGTFPAETLDAAAPDAPKK